MKVLLFVEVNKAAYAKDKGIPILEVEENVIGEFIAMGDALTWRVTDSQFIANSTDGYCDVVQTILARPQAGSGGGIPLTRGEVAMLFFDGYAGDRPGLLDIRSQGYGDDDLWDGLTAGDVFEDEDTVFVWGKWEPLELWADEPR